MKTKTKETGKKLETLESLDTQTLQRVGGGFNRSDVDWRTVGRILCAPIGGGC